VINHGIMSGPYPTFRDPTTFRDERRERADDRLARENAALRDEVEHLRTLALTDALTGLPNRRYLGQRLTAEVARALRFAQPLAVLVIDVDDFKRVNDTWGHDKGDEVLCWVAAFVRSQVRACDVACRTGGDEFVVLLPGTGDGGAAALAARMRWALAALRRDSGRSDHPVKLSVGWAALGPGAGDATALLAAADHAMYQAKAQAKRQARLA
jgi:diguanylate cyclase (GGDEF)-like protein